MWIDFEGIDGSGKTTISIRVARRLRDFGWRVTHAREGGVFRSRVAAGIRELTRDPESVLIAPVTELLLNAAREAQVLAEEVAPALKRGDVVITDRALHSHFALATGARRLAPESARCVVDLAAGGLWPDIVILVDVDPDIARYRKRLRRVHERRFGSASRKGLAGRSLARLLREALCRMAQQDPRRWRILDNTARTVDEAEVEALAILSSTLPLPTFAQRPAPAPPTVAPAESLLEWKDHYLHFTQTLCERDPALAALFAAGIEDPRADAVREAAAEVDPDVAAYSVRGMTHPSSWEIRRRTRPDAPQHVARSLTGLDDSLAWSWREDLRCDAPDQVLHSLLGLARPEAHALRVRLWPAAPEEGLRSIAGLSDAASWGLRMRALRASPGGALAESLRGLDGAAAWRIRDDLAQAFPLAVLRGLKGIDAERAWAMRESMAVCAPKIVLESISGMGGSRADQLRGRLRASCPEEVGESLSGLDTPEAWKLRRELVDRAPQGVLDGLRGLESHELARPLIETALARSQGSPHVVRKAIRVGLREGPAAEPE